MHEPTPTPVQDPEITWATDAFLFNAHNDFDDVEDGSPAISPDTTPAPIAEASDPHKEVATAPEDLVPTTLVAVKAIGGQSRFRPLVVLLDSGGSHTMIKRGDLPRSALETTQSKLSFATAAGNLKTTLTVELTHLVLPEFSRSLHVPKCIAHVFDDLTNSIRYDLILGRDFLHSAGITIDFKKAQVIWLDHTIAMRSINYWSDTTRIRDALLIEPVLTQQLSTESHVVSISAARYEATDLDDLVSNQAHLSADQCKDLLDLFKSVEPLFSGKLGCYPHPANETCTPA